MSTFTLRSRLVLAALLGAGHVPVATAQQPVALLREGDTLDGTTVTLNNVATNGIGGYCIGVNAADNVSRFWGNPTGGPGVVLRAEGTFGPLVQTGFETFYGISDAGSIAYSPTGTGGPVGNFDSIFLDDAPVAVEGDPVPTIAGNNWVFGSRPAISASGEPWWVGGYGPVASTTARALFRGTGSTPVLKTGDPVAGIADTVNASSVQFSFRISGAATHWIGITLVTGLAANDNVVVIDNAAAMAGGSVVREGTVIPVASGGDGVETYQAFSNLAINDSGSWLLTADSNAAAAGDAFIMLDGQIIHREGQSIDGLPLTGSFDWADLNESGDWVVSWNVTSGGTREALIFNGRVVLKETDPIDFDGDGAPDAGVTLTDLTTGIDNMYMSERFGNGTVDIYFTGDTSIPVTTANEGFYRLTLQARCAADFNNSGAATVQDIFDFLGAYFANGFLADFNRSGGVSVQDIFDFLAAYFAGC